PGRWFLWQVGVKAPGTANSTTFFPLNTSSVVLHAGPSAVITLNFASGTRSPTLMAITILSRAGGEGMLEVEKLSINAAAMIRPRRGPGGRFGAKLASGAN